MKKQRQLFPFVLILCMPCGKVFLAATKLLLSFTKQFFYFYRMKKILLASLLLSINFFTFCQNKKSTDIIPLVIKDSLPKYAKNKVIPSFKILIGVSKKDAAGKMDSTWFSNENLPNNRPIVIIYFSPECSHCVHEMKEIEKKMDSLKNAFFVFASYHPLDSIKNFEIKYNISSYPNIAMGRDTKYFLPVYYDVKYTPFMAVYDTHKNFAKAYDQGANMHELIQLVNAKPAEIVIEKKSKKKHNPK